MFARLRSLFSPAPVLTVALPMYRSRRIAWLALESLARQQDVNFPWELIVAEEPDEAFRQKRVLACRPALRRAGCVRIHYIKVKRWLPLSLKWRLIARHASPRSSVFLLHAADCYSPPRRLRETFDAMADPAVDWYQTAHGSAYHLRHRITLRFDAEHPPYDYPTHYYMAMRTHHARALPPAEVERGVDRWLFESATALKRAPLNVAQGRDGWRGGMETKGLNCISLLDAFFRHPSPPFRPDDENLFAALPSDIQAWLLALGDEPITPDAERRRRLARNLRRRAAKMGSHEAPPSAP